MLVADDATHTRVENASRFPSVVPSLVNFTLKSFVIRHMDTYDLQNLYVDPIPTRDSIP